MKTFTLILGMFLLSQISFGAQVIPLGTLNVATVDIASGGTVSGAKNTAGTVLVGIHLPAAFTGTALTFQTATGPSATYHVMKASSGSSLSYTVGQGTYVIIDPKDFNGAQYLKVVSGTAEGAARTLTLMLKGM